MVRVLVLLVILGVPGSAIGSVVPNACIAGVGLWDSRERVAREWGLPTSISQDGPDTLWHYPKASVLLYRWYKPWQTPRKPIRWIVLVITTTDPHERFKGIGVGSWRSEVRAASDRGCGDKANYCTLASDRTESHSTDVSFKGNRVVELSVSLSSDFDDGVIQYADKRCRAD